MKSKSSANNKLLRTYKDIVSPKIYALLIKLVNEDREDLANKVIKVDYLISYCSTSIKGKDFKEAKEVLDGIDSRIQELQNADINVEHLNKLRNELKSRIK